MARKKVSGKCCICGTVGPLTFEHIPPEAAFNDGKILEADAEFMLRAQTFHEMMDPPKRQSQRGAGRYSLCGRCNSVTGAWYVPAYREWARQGWWNVNHNPDRIMSRPFEIEPLRVIKQIIAMFASACGPQLFEGSPNLRKFVLNQEEAGLPSGFRVFAYYMHPKSSASRQSGITSNGHFAEPFRIHVYAEIAFPPFGYLICVSDTPAPDRRLVEITFMADSKLGERREVSLPLPGLEVNSVLPADFRSMPEIRQAYLRNLVSGA